MSTAPLSPADETLVASLRAGRPASSVVLGLNRARAVLRVSDLRILQGVTWLTDEIMNSFVCLINHWDTVARALAVVRPEGQTADAIAPAGPALPRTHMLSTFFFLLFSERAGVYDYNCVRTWAGKGNLRLNAIDLILVSVHVHNSHWVLTFIDVQSGLSIKYDSYFGDGHGPRIHTLRRWLIDEETQHIGDDFTAGWEVGTWPLVIDTSLPKHADAGSCGVFSLAAAECLSPGSPVSFSQSDIPDLRQRLAMALYADDLRSERTVSRPTPLLSAVAPDGIVEGGGEEATWRGCSGGGQLLEIWRKVW